MTHIENARLRMSVGLRHFRKFILQFTPDFTELQLAWMNVAMAVYLFIQSLFAYREDPPFYNAIVSIAPTWFWIAVFLGVAVFSFRARVTHNMEARQNASSLSMMLWVFVLCFLWSSFVWSSGKISIVHFISPVIVFSSMATCVRLCAERRKVSFERIVERRLSAMEGERPCQSGSSYFNPSV